MDAVDLKVAPWDLRDRPIVFSKAVYRSEMTNSNSEFEKAQEIQRIAHALHLDFETKQKGKSFHNIGHIQAVEAAVEATLSKIDTTDPFGLKNALSAWNSQRTPSERATQVDLEMAIKIAAATHDLGNIIDTMGFADQGFVPRFNEKYVAKGAEERSKNIARTLMTGIGFNNKSIAKVLPLVEHLIGETTYNFSGKNAGFAAFMRTVDQIGNGLFNPINFDTNLLFEMVGENPEATFVPDKHFNFVIERFPYLVPNVNARSEILRIWNKSLPKRKEGLSKEGVKISDYLASNFDSNRRTH